MKQYTRPTVLLHIIQVEGIICTNRYFVTVSLYEKRVRGRGVKYEASSRQESVIP